MKIKEEFVEWLEENHPEVLDSFRCYDYVWEEYGEEFLIEKKGQIGETH